MEHPHNHTPAGDSFYDLPAEKFPMRIVLFHPETRAELWFAGVSKPPAGERFALEIPPLAMQLGHPVSCRLEFGDGEIVEGPPHAR